MFDDLIVAAIEDLFGFFVGEQGEGMGIQGEGLGIGGGSGDISNGGGSGCIDLSPVSI